MPPKLPSHCFSQRADFRQCLCFYKHWDWKQKHSQPHKICNRQYAQTPIIDHNPIHPRLFPQIPSDFAPIFTNITPYYAVLNKKPTLSIGTANKLYQQAYNKLVVQNGCITRGLVRIPVSEDFTYFYFRSTNPTNSRQLVLEQQVICLIIKTPLANSKVCTSVFYLKATHNNKLLISTNTKRKKSLMVLILYFSKQNSLKKACTCVIGTYRNESTFQTRLLSITSINLTFIHSLTIPCMLPFICISSSFAEINQCTMLFCAKAMKNYRTEITLNTPPVSPFLQTSPSRISAVPCSLPQMWHQAYAWFWA